VLPGGRDLVTTGVQLPEAQGKGKEAGFRSGGATGKKEVIGGERRHTGRLMRYINERGEGRSPIIYRRKQNRRSARAQWKFRRQKKKKIDGSSRDDSSEK